MSYDEILENSGGFGRYQKFVCLLLFLSAFPNGYFNMSSVFVVNSPEHHCKVINDRNLSLDSFLNSTIPWVKQQDGSWKQSQCLQYTRPQNVTVSNHNETSKTTTCLNGWNYSASEGEVTMVTEFNMVCDRAWEKPFTTSLYFVGILIGSLFGGPLSDKYGRRVIFLWATLGQFVTMFLTGFTPSVKLYGIAMFFAGLTGLVNYMTGFLLISEFMESSNRTVVGALFANGYSLGYMLLPMFAYFIPNWRWLLRSLSLLGFFYIPYYWVLPESPRWLITKGKVKEAHAIIKRMFRVNGKDYRKLELEKLISVSKDSLEVNKQNKTSQLKLVMELMKQRSFRARSLVLYFLWFTASMSYFCLSLGTSDMGGDKIVNCFISASIEIPGTILGFFCMEKFGRRITTSTSFSIAGLFCILTPFVGPVGSLLSTASAMIGKFMVSAIFNCLYLYTGELYPTLLRNSGMGMCSTVSRLGNILSPYMIYAGYSVHRSLPFIAMGLFCLVSFILTLMLPETKSSVFPDTVQDAIDLDRHKLKLLIKKKHEFKVSDKEEAI